MNTYTQKAEDSIDPANCGFCNELAEHQLLKDYGKFLLIAALYPYVDNHILLIPKKHLHSELDFDDELWNELNVLHKKVVKLFYKNFGKCFYFARDNQPSQSMWHWHRHYMPTDVELKLGLSRVEFKKIELNFEE